MRSSSRIMYPLFRANAIGPYMRFTNFSHAVRQEQLLPRIPGLFSPHNVPVFTEIPGDTGVRLRIIALYERIRRDGSECGNPSKACDIEGRQNGEKSSSKVKRKASKSSWARKQKAENAAYDKALVRGRFDEFYRLRSQWMTSWGPKKETEQICHKYVLDKQGLPNILWDHEHDLDECMYHDEDGRIRFFGEDGQVFYQEEWASMRGYLKKLISGTMETTERGTK